MFAGPPQDSAAWSDAGVEGAHRFLRRLWSWAAQRQDALRHATRGTVAHDAAAKALRFEVHSLLKQISYDYERLQYNTVVSGAMKLLNALEDAKDAGIGAPREGLSILLRALYPACPHTTWVLWQELGYDDEFGDLLDAAWPQVDDSALVRSEIELVLQINGKHRGSIVVPADAPDDVISAVALATPEVAKFAEGKRARVAKIARGKLVSIVS
jgi:leucyl-tRNA synthetase